MQSYPTMQNYSYGNNPYGSYHQSIMPYQDRFSQFQNQYNQNAMSYAQPQFGLNGQMVGSIDEVKAKDVDLSGAPMWFPKADGSEVYRKQLQPDGTSKILTYTLSVNDTQDTTQQPINMDVLNTLLGQLKQDLLSEISVIKDLIPAQMPVVNEPPKTQRGGNQK